MFCAEMLQFIRQNVDFAQRVVFTDEATFTTAGMFNRQNKRYWSVQNPHKYQEVRIQGRQSLNVWCGIKNNKILGPIIFEGTLTGDRYLNFLTNEIEVILQNIPNNGDQLIWQQDGAPPHNTRGVTNYLNDKYELWIGRNGPIRWPANSPDLSPLDIFLWGYLKNKIYYNRPENTNILRNRIEEEIMILNNEHPNFISNSISKFKNNILKCFQNNGGYIEV